MKLGEPRGSLKYKVYPLYFLLQGFTCLLISLFALRLYSYDLRVPFHYGGDSLVILMFIKGMLLNGWTWSIPQLSAPFELSAAAFPVMSSFDWLIMKAISLFSNEPGYILNVFWLSSLILSCWTATLCMRLIGIAPVFCFFLGVAYAFLPFALLRNVSHLNLVYYLVPLLAVLSLHIASGAPVADGKMLRRLGYAACVAQGFNYIYFSFFAVLLFVFAAILSTTNGGGRRGCRTAIIAISLVISCSMINLSPTFYSWSVFGKPPEMGYKHPAEAEIYGAKLRKMISPHPANQFPILGSWGKKDAAAQFPNENENVTARLGLIGSAGLLLLGLISLGVHRPAAERPGKTLQVLASLSLFTFLVITVGGLGAIINLLSVPDIRTYNRFSVYLSWFCLAALGLWLTKKLQSGSFNGAAGWVRLAALGLVFCVGIYDQLLDRAGLLKSREVDTSLFHEEQVFFKKLSTISSSELVFFQLPLTGFPPLSVHERMISYDHLRPFLWMDERFRWSWPSFSWRHREWQEKIGHLSGADLLDALCFSGFNMIWIDRYAYKDNADNLVASLTSHGAVEVLSGESDRYALFSIKSRNILVRKRLGHENFKAMSEAWLSPISIRWGEGFYAEEVGQHGARFRWSKQNSSVAIVNSGPARSVRVLFSLASQAEGRVALMNKDIMVQLQSRTIPDRHELAVDLPAHSKVRIKFKSDVNRVDAPSDPREMYFYISHFSVEPMSKI